MLRSSAQPLQHKHKDWLTAIDSDGQNQPAVGAVPRLTFRAQEVLNRSSGLERQFKFLYLKIENKKKGGGGGGETGGRREVVGGFLSSVCRGFCSRRAEQKAQRVMASSSLSSPGCLSSHPPRSPPLLTPHPLSFLGSLTVVMRCFIICISQLLIEREFRLSPGSSVRELPWETQRRQQL